VVSQQAASASSASPCHMLVPHPHLPHLPVAAGADTGAGVGVHPDVPAAPALADPDPGRVTAVSPYSAPAPSSLSVTHPPLNTFQLTRNDNMHTHHHPRPPHSPPNTYAYPHY
jgi:hypothetical protein